MPTACEIPRIEISHLETVPLDPDVNFRGVGEGGMIVAPATVVNAIEDALAPFGVRIYEQHLPPARILELDRRRPGHPAVGRRYRLTVALLAVWASAQLTTRSATSSVVAARKWSADGAVCCSSATHSAVSGSITSAPNHASLLATTTSSGRGRSAIAGGAGERNGEAGEMNCGTARAGAISAQPTTAGWMIAAATAAPNE